MERPEGWRRFSASSKSSAVAGQAAASDSVKAPTTWRRSSRPPSSTPCSAETPCTDVRDVNACRNTVAPVPRQPLRKVLDQVIRHTSDGLFQGRPEVIASDLALIHG